MTEGGDARIVLDPVSGLNRYHSAPRPSDVLAYASSTANDVSAPAYAHVAAALAAMAPDGALRAAAYADALKGLRVRLRKAYAIEGDVSVVFAPSGTDLEFVALACLAGKGAGIHNVLLGADEVGSGCIHSARGHYFANETALGLGTEVGETVPGLEGVTFADVPVRDAGGAAIDTHAIAAAIGREVSAAAAEGRVSLVHGVHGSKTGLILPELAEIDALQAAHGNRVIFVIDACQARITTQAIGDYLMRGCIVLLTGSKFMGGPPFSGFALVPDALMRGAATLPSGFATLFRRAEWPQGWAGRDSLPDEANLGLLLRLEASLFELERLQALPMAQVETAIRAFRNAVEALAGGIGAGLVAPVPPGDAEEAYEHPLEMLTLATLDLSAGGATFEDAQGWQKGLLEHGIRLGQPVKCVKLPGGGWGATLRVGLSMPILSERAAMDEAAMRESFAADMSRIGEALDAVRA